MKLAKDSGFGPAAGTWWRSPCQRAGPNIAHVTSLFSGPFMLCSSRAISCVKGKADCGNSVFSVWNCLRASSACRAANRGAQGEHGIPAGPADFSRMPLCIMSFHALHFCISAVAFSRLGVGMIEEVLVPGPTSKCQAKCSPQNKTESIGTEKRRKHPAPRHRKYPPGHA